MRTLVVALLALAACGPSKPADTTATRSGGADKDALCSSAMSAAMDANEAAWNQLVSRGEPTTLEEMATAACQRFCGRATECAIQEACDKMTGDEIADLRLDKTAPENTAQCTQSCNQATLSRKQIQTLGECSQDDESTCAAFRECTAGAAPAAAGPS